MTARIRPPADGPAWLPGVIRNTEREIDRANGELDTRVSALEDELMALTEAAESMADALASIERMTVVQAAALQATVDLLAQIEALSRGQRAPRPAEEGSALIAQYINAGD